jgi:Cof subfamily protein (haloacid dehalogenase superfamily)
VTRPPVRLIATDLDGTLLRSDGTVSERARRSILAAIEAGIEVVPATGRPHMVAEHIIDQLAFVHHWILSNGTVTWHHGRQETVRGFWLDPEQARELIGRVRRHLPDAAFAVELDRSILYEPAFSNAVAHLPVPPVGDLTASIDQRVQKVLIYNGAVDIEALHGEISHIVATDAYATFSGLQFIELSAGYVTKATALGHLASDLGVDPGEVAAFGDYQNDVAMLEWSGRSYAMAHATEVAKAAADEIIGSNDDDAVPAKIDELVAEATPA